MNDQRVSLVMLNPNGYGGTVTYTAHLYHSLRSVGLKPTIYRLGSGTGTHIGPPRDFGYGCVYRSATLDGLLRLKGVVHVTACIGLEYGRPTRLLLEQGACLTIHDPNDLSGFGDDRSFLSSPKIILIRAHNTVLAPAGTYIPHPFVRRTGGRSIPAPRPRHAVTLSRLGSIKRTKWVLEANRQLPSDKQIWLRGYDDRFFTYTNLVATGKYPEFKQDSQLPPEEKKTFAKNMGEAQSIAERATYLVDLTEIKGDGGGTQYTFFEGLDAGCCLVLNKAWTRPPHWTVEERNKYGLWHHGVNCLEVYDANELVRTLNTKRSRKEIQDIVRVGQSLFPAHAPEVVGEQYLAFYQRHKT